MVEWLSSFDPHTRAWCQDGGGCGIHWCAVCAPCQPHMFVSYCTFTSWHDDAESLQQPVLIANLMWFMYMRHIRSFKSWSTMIMWLITSEVRDIRQHDPKLAVHQKDPAIHQEVLEMFLVWIQLTFWHRIFWLDMTWLDCTFADWI